jgi:hypothetical protein
LAVYVPWKNTRTGEAIGYSLIFLPPERDTPSVDVTRLVITMALVAGLTAAAVLLTGPTLGSNGEPARAKVSSFLSGFRSLTLGDRVTPGWGSLVPVGVFVVAFLVLLVLRNSRPTPTTRRIVPGSPPPPPDVRSVLRYPLPPPEVRLTSRINRLGNLWGTVHNETGLRINTMKLRITTARWERVYEADVGAANKSTQSFHVNIPEDPIDVENVYVLSYVVQNGPEQITINGATGRPD